MKYFVRILRTDLILSLRGLKIYEPDTTTMNTHSDFQAKKNRVSTRFERDIEQRKSAKRRYRDVRKMLPKVTRERDIRKERKARQNVSVIRPEDDEFRQEGFGDIGQALPIIGAVGVGAFLAKAGSAALGILQNALKGSNMANKLLEDITNIFQSLKSAVVSLLDKMWVVPVAVLAYWLLDKFAGNTAVIVVITTAIAAIFGKKMWGFVSCHFNVGFRQESGFSDSPFKALIMSVMCFSYLPREAGKLMTVLMTRVAILPRLSSGLEALFKMAVSICEAVINTILSLVSVKDKDGKQKTVFLGDAAYRAVKEWTTESHRFKSCLLDKPTTTQVVEIYDHVKKGYIVLQTLKDMELSAIMKRALDNLEFALQPFMGVVTAGKNFRAEPHFVLFTGKAGVGKSSLLVKFAVSVLLAAGEAKPADVMKQLFQKGSTEYWNGYVGQKCTIVDDLFQKVPALGEADSEYENIIRMVNAWLFPLNMADLPSKGKFFFDSPLLLGTTNASNIRETSYAQVVKTPDAIVRRIHTPVYIEASPEYSIDGKMDYDKMENEFLQRLTNLNAKEHKTADDVLSCIPWEAWRAKTINFQDFVFPTEGVDSTFSESIDLKQLVLQVASSLRMKQMQHAASVGAMEKYAELLGELSVFEQSGGGVSTVPQEIEESSDCSSDENTGGLDESIKPSKPGDIPITRRDLMTTFASLSDAVSEFNSEAPPDAAGPDRRRFLALARKFRSSKSDYVLSEPDLEKRIKEYAKAGEIPNIFQSFFIEVTNLYAPMFVYDLLDKSTDFNAVNASITKDSRTVRLLGIADDVANGVAFDYEKAERTMSTIFEIISQQGYMDALGMNSGSLTAFISWFSRTRKDLDTYYEEGIALSKWVDKQATMQHTIKNIFKSLLISVRKLQPFGIVSGIAGIVAIVSMLKISFDIIVKLMKSVYQAVRAVLGLGDEPEKVVTEVVKPVVETQGNHLAVLQDAEVYDKIYANLHTIFLPDIDVQVGHVLFLDGNLAVMPNHLFADITKRLTEGVITPESRLSLLNGAEKYNKITITVGQFLSVPRYSKAGLITDSVFLHFPRDMNATARARISQHFVLEADYKAVAMSALPCRVDMTRLAKANGVIRMARHTSSAPVVKKVMNMPIGPITPEFMWSSSHLTQLGDCGAPHMLARRSTCPQGRSILGIHVGGNASFCQPMAVAIPISGEMIDDARNHFKSITDDFETDLATKGIKLSMVDLEVQAGLKMVGLIGGSFELIGEVDTPVSIAPKTRFTHTPLAKDEPFGPSGLKIAHLSPVSVGGTIKYPMVEGLRNYQSPLLYRDIPDLDLIVSIATQRFQKESVYDTREIFSFEEAVLSPALMKLKAINRATSAGFPFVLDGKPGKRAYFGSGEEYDLSGEDCQKLKDRVFDIIEAAKCGRRLSHICIDFLKDETRPAAKVDACATRIISGTPLDYSIACRMYFGAFMAAMFRCNTLSGFTPGINPYQEWWVLASELRNGGEYFFDGDFSRFDASEQPYILWAILKFINTWYDDGPENARIREVLFMDLVHSRHITNYHGPLKYIVQWTKCLPSGHPMTTPVNSIYAMIALVLCYARTTGSCVDFWEHCFAGTNGDDNIVAVKEDRIQLFNQVSVEKAMREHLDLTYTSGSKDGTLIVHKPFESLIYLKRCFKEDSGNTLARGGWLAPLELQSFLYSAYVTRARKDVAQDICNNLEFALGELSLHDTEVWDRYAHIIKEQMNRFGMAPKFGVNRDSYRQFMASKTDFWY